MRIRVLCNVVSALIKTALVVLIYGGIGFAVILATVAVAGAATTCAPAQRGFKIESYKTDSAGNAFDCTYKRASPSRSEESAVVPIAPTPVPSLVCAGQVVPWASTYLCLENGTYTKVWNTQTRLWGSYYPMAYTAPNVVQQQIVVVPGRRHYHRESDPIREVSRFIRTLEGRDRYQHRRHYRHRHDRYERYERCWNGWRTHYC